MYKDKGKQKEASKERMRKMRERRNIEGVTKMGVTWYPNKRTDEQGQPINPVTLSDGQRWYPRSATGMEENVTGLPDNVYLSIVQDSQRHGRFEERVEKALAYQECKLLEVTA